LTTTLDVKTAKAIATKQNDADRSPERRARPIPSAASRPAMRPTTSTGPGVNPKRW
jgi:hypothetical protein